MKRLTDKPRTNVEAIIRFVLHNDIMLTKEQQDLSDRLFFTDMLIRKRKWTRDEVIRMIRVRFQISQWRANQDITDAHKVFGETRKLNKQYLLSHHIEEIQLQIQMAKEKGMEDLLPKLNANLTDALNALPVDKDPLDSRPKKVMYVFGDINLNESSGQAENKKPLSAALKEADDLLQKNSNGEYLEFEEE
jgi:hypothetical protein